MTTAWLPEYLARVGRLWFANPVWLLAFTIRLIMSLRYTLVGLFSPTEAGQLARRVTGQTVKTFFRGIAMILALATAGAAGLAWVSVRLGSLARGAFDEFAVPILFSHVVPLGLAVILVARTGGTVAVLFAIESIEKQRTVRYPPPALQAAVVPHVVASVVNAAAFYLVTASLLLAGYHARSLQGVFNVDLSAYFSAGAGWLPLREGLVKTTVFGLVIGVAASGLGIQVSEGYDPANPTGHPHHYVVWETVALVTLICTLLTVVL